MTSTQWSPTTKRLVIAGLVILLLIGLWLFRTILPPLLLAIVLAYLLKPPVDLLVRRTRLPRTAAVLLVFLALFLIVAVVSFTLVPYLAGQTRRLADQLQGLIRDVAAFLARPVVLFSFHFRPQDLVGDLPATLQEFFRPFTAQTITLLVSIASSLLWVLAILVIAFYLVRDAAQLRAFLDRVAPPGYSEEMACLREEINGVWTQFFRGQIVLCIIIGLAVWLAMAIVGLPGAGLMGLISGVLEVIPNFGPVLATVPALFVAFFRGSNYLPLSNFWFTVLVLGLYALIQQAENSYLVPRVMGRRMRVHPVIVFIGVLAGGYLMGALGVFLAAPVLGTLAVLVRYTYAKLLDQDPFPPPKRVHSRRRVSRPPYGPHDAPAQVSTGPQPADVDAILFDLDGTLIETDDEAVDSLARRLQPLRRLLPGLDSAAVSRRLLVAAEGPAAALLGVLDRFGLDEGLLDLGERLRRLRGVPDIRHVRSVDGTAATLKQLGRRYKLAIVTTRSRREAMAFLAQAGLSAPGIIQVITGRDDTWRIKPHPSPLLHTVKQLGVPVERCLMVGDTTADIRAAQAAGAWAAGVLSGFGARKELERAGADMILDSANCLAEWTDEAAGRPPSAIGGREGTS